MHEFFSFDNVHLYSLCSTYFVCQNDTQFQLKSAHLIITCIWLRTASTNILAFWKLCVTLTPILEFWPVLKATYRTRFHTTYSWVEIGCQNDTHLKFPKSSKFWIPLNFWIPLGEVTAIRWWKIKRQAIFPILLFLINIFPPLLFLIKTKQRTPIA